MRIGLLTADLSHRHGWAHYSLSLLQALARLGIEMQIVAPHDSPEIEGLNIQRLLPGTNPMEANLLLQSMRCAPQVGQIMRGCDLIHSLLEPYAPLGKWIAAGRPSFVTAHGTYVDLLPRRRISGRLYRWGLENSHLICVSHYTARVARQVLPNAETSVIPNGIDAERFGSLATGRVAKQGPTILSVGAIKLRKGTLELVRAVAKVRESIPDIQCVIIGRLDVAEGYIQQVEAEIHALRLDQQVRLLGYVDEATLLGWYGAADLFVLPSMNVGHRFEGFGLAYLEASAAGLPVIGTNDTGAEDAIEDSVTGLLVPQSTVTSALPDAIISLLQDPPRAQQMGTAGRARALRHTWDNTAHQLVRLYEQARA